MEFTQDFSALSAEGIYVEATRRKAQGWRYVQILAVNLDEGADVIYSFMKDGHLENLVVHDVPRGGKLDSISDLFLEAFVCENEIHDLFGISFKGLVINFLGNFYKLSTEAPMTIISPEQLAQREKAAKEAKAKEAASGASGASGGASPDAEAELEAKLQGMDPEKAAKVRAAMAAKAKRAAAKEGE